MSMLIQHNMMAWNAERQFNTVTKAKNKKAEKLSSGYRINRAADDAAGLSISEKMRRQIRGLKVGTENAEMGISWVQIGEGALNEAHEILHRMNELSIKSQNGTNTLTDRAYMEAEFEQLQGELDRISTTTTFNELNIFEEHEPIYDQICGNKHWDYEEYHTITDRNNKLIVEYREYEGGPQQTVTLTVAPGSYTTHELIDEIDTAFGVDSPIHMEYTEKGFCRLNLEGCEKIDTVTGGLQYLLWDTYNAGGYGALIGTTEFEKDTDTLKIVRGQNDRMDFQIEYFDDKRPSETLSVDLLKEAGNVSEIRYTKEQLMGIIDRQVKTDTTGLKTSHYGNCIMLSSDDGIVTGFKGNMFKIEKEDPKYTSAFYDNIQEGYVRQDPAFVAGGPVLTTDTRDKEHNRFYIDGTNDTLVLYPNQTTSSKTGPTTIKITHNTTDGYDAQQMVNELNKQFKNAGIDMEVEAHLVRSTYRDLFPDKKAPDGSGPAVTESVGDDKVYFEGVEIRTKKEGPDAMVNLLKVKDAAGKDTNQIDKTANTAYDTLFRMRNYNAYGSADASVDNEYKDDENAYAMSSKDKNGTLNVTSRNNKFNITLRSTVNRNGYSAQDFSQTYTITVKSGSRTAQNLVDDINASIKANADKNLQNRIKAELKDGKIRIVDVDKKDDKVLDDVNDPYLNWNTTIELSTYGGNNGYRDIFQQSYTYDVPITVSKRGSFTLNVPTTGVGSGMTIYINGVKTDFTFGADKTAAGLAGAINKTVYKKFGNAYAEGQTRSKNFAVNGQGTTDYIYWAGGEAQGDSVEHQGKAGYEKNAPAQLEIGPELKAKMLVERGKNDKIALSLNGKNYVFTLDTSDPADSSVTSKEYTREGLADALQAAIDAQCGEGMGGALVSVKNSRLFITSRLPSDEDGKKTSIRSYAQGESTNNTFFDSLNRVEEAASCTSEQDMLSSITLVDDGSGSDKFTFSFKDSTGTYNNIVLDLTDSTTGETFTRTQLKDRIDQKLKEAGHAYTGKVSASLDGNRLVLTTTEEGAGTSVSYTSGSGTNTNANAKAIFGDLGNSIQTNAEFTLDQAVVANPGTLPANEREFVLWVNNQRKSVTIDGWNNNSGTASQHLDKKLNAAFAAEGINVEASLVGGKLHLKNNDAGAGTSLRMQYDTGGSIMSHMFGTEPRPGVTVTPNASKKTLTITAGANDVITIKSNESGGLLKGDTAIGYYDHDSDGGFHSAKYSTLTSTTLDADGYELNRWNNDLKFYFTEDDGKTYKEVSVTLPNSAPNAKTSLADIQTQLQSALNAAMGKDADGNDKIKVLLANNRLTLQSTRPGSQFRFLTGNETATVNGKTVRGLQSNSQDDGDVGGGFFHHVMNRRTLQHKEFNPTDVNGEQYVDDIFAQGRHNVATERTHLTAGISDTLELDLTYMPDANHDGTVDATEMQNKKVITLKLQLEPNRREDQFYTRDSLLAMIRRQLKAAINSADAQKQAKDLGIQLHDDVIDADIGIHDTGIYGNRDRVSLSFTLTKNHDVSTPDEGYFYIDGVRGNAAYETFYRTEGELIPSYIVGTKDISQGVTLGPNDKELVFTVDGEEKTVKLKPGKYSAEDIVKVLADSFKDQGVPLGVELTKKGNLKVSFTRMGNHTIEKVTGSARNELFFIEHAAKRTSNERDIRVSSFEGDRLSVYSPRFSTSLLGINSICISTVKNAEKATNRLKEAIRKVSDMRSTFGAIQNRFEHTVNNNLNKHENLQAAESRIRDADISKEMVDFSNLSIIQQAGQAVLAQANQSRNAMLALLG